MRTHHQITIESLILAAALVVSCSRAPSSSTESSGSPTIAETNSASKSSQSPEVIIPAGNVNLNGVDLSQFLYLYAQLSNAKLDTSQLGKLPHTKIYFSNTNDVTSSEALLLFDKVLYDQAGIVATHVDTSRIVLKLRSDEVKN